MIRIKLNGFSIVLLNYRSVVVYLFLSFISFQSMGQSIDFIKLKKKADSLFYIDDFSASAKYLEKIVGKEYARKNDFLRLAISYSMLGDSIRSLNYLVTSIQEGLFFNDSNDVDKYKYFSKIKTYKEWPVLRNEIINNKSTRKKVFENDSSLHSQLKYRLETDQKYRVSVKNPTYINNPKLKDSIWTLQEINDSLNQRWLDSLVNKEGWRIINKNGAFGNKVAWLIIQHADKNLDFQLKYLDTLQSQITTNKYLSINYAYLKDRVLVNMGEKQIYGTQFKLERNNKGEVISIEPKPLKYPNYVDEFRSYVYLNSLADYLKSCYNNYK